MISFRPISLYKTFPFAFLISCLLLLVSISHAHAAAYNASDVLGQIDASSSISFTQFFGSSANPWGMSTPIAVTIDTTHHRLFVADQDSNRVLIFNLDTSNNLVDHRADNVLGPSSFASTTSGTTQSLMNIPNGIAYDATNDRLFVSEYSNNRILIYNTASITDGMNASYVLGQTTFTSSTGGTTSSTLSQPYNLAYDSTNSRLFVADKSNNRVLIWNVVSGTVSNGMPASFTLGQTVFTTATSTTSQAGMNAPSAVVYDATNSRLFVGQNTSNRVTVYDVATGTVSNGQNATFVLGQTVFTTTTSTASQGGLKGMQYGLAYDSTNSRLFVSDDSGRRVLVYDVATGTVSNGQNATFVLGQTVFTTTTSTASQVGIKTAGGSTYDSGNSRLYFTDYSSHRVMIYNVATGTVSNGMNASDLLGQIGNDAPIWAQSSSYNNASPPVASTTLAASAGYSALDSVNHRLFVSDDGNKRIVVFNLDAGNNLIDHAADFVLGQINFASSTSGTTSSTLSTIYGLAYDSTNTRLFAADYGNARVLVYNVASGTLATGMPASFVLGQTTFTSSTLGTTSSTLRGPEGLAYDATNNRLFVSDNNSNNRVLVYNVASGTLATTSTPASFVLGQVSFTASSAGTTSSTLSLPEGINYDPINSRLFVADDSNNRVLVYNVASGTLVTTSTPASFVLGQSIFTASGSGTTSSTLNAPTAAVYDTSSTLLFVADYSNNRVLTYAAASGTLATGVPALGVLGQTSFTVSAAATTQTNLNTPWGLGLDFSNRRLYVGDSTNKRMMIYNVIQLSTSTITIPTLSQKGSYSISLYFNPSNAQGTVTAAVSSGALPSGMSLSGGYLTGTPAGGTDGNYTFAFQVSDAISGIGSFSDFSTSYSFAVSTPGVHSSSGGGSATDPSLLKAYLASLTSKVSSNITAPSIPPQFLHETGEGQASTPPRATSTPQLFLITKNLKLGTTDPQVKLLQQFLNTHGFILSLSGPGSKGKETSLFGRKTYQALIKFQEAHQAEILTPWGLMKGTGFLGVWTRGVINGL